MAFATLTLLLSGALAEAGPRETPSGQPVPRYVATRFKEVNARGGPGDDYKLLWTYRAVGLPLQVVEETFDWRRVCDPDGGLAWVHRRTVDGDRRAMNRKGDPIPLLAAPKPAGRQVALLAPHATTALGPCKQGWCRIKAGRVSGFVPRAAIWGADDARQCRPPGG